MEPDLEQHPRFLRKLQRNVRVVFFVFGTLLAVCWAITLIANLHGE